MHMLPKYTTSSVHQFSIIHTSYTCKIQVTNNVSFNVFQWGLVCSRSNLAALAQSLVIGGQGIGALIMSHLSDRFGRKTVHVLSHVAVMATMLIMAFSSSIYMLLVLRLVAGTFQQVGLVKVVIRCIVYISVPT